MTHHRIFTNLLLLLIAGSASAAPTYAAAEQLTSPAELSPGGVTTGYPGGPSDRLSSPLTVVAGGDTLTFTILTSRPAATFERANEGTGWHGNFPPGTGLLFNTYPDGPVSIASAEGVAGAGLRAQAAFGGAQTFVFSAFNDVTPLGTFAVVTGANTAPFLGVRAIDDDIITRLFLARTGFNGNSFAIGPVTFTPTQRKRPPNQRRCCSSGPAWPGWRRGFADVGAAATPATTADARPVPAMRS